FAIIIAAFVFTFGSQGGLQGDCGGASASYVMVVDGNEIPQSSWRFGMNTLQSRSRDQRAQVVLDQLLVREIPARAGEEAGTHVRAAPAPEHIRRGRCWILGNPQSGQNLFLDRAFEGSDQSRPTWVLA